METVAQLLEIKGHNVWSISPDASVYEAIERMADKQVGDLLVLQDEKLVGIISERDYTRKVILKGRASKDTLVREIMTYPVVYSRPGETIENCLALMTIRHIRHLPIFAGDRLVGIVSIGDLVKAIIAEQGVLIQQLENHILEHVGIT